MVKLAPSFSSFKPYHKKLFCSYLPYMHSLGVTSPAMSGPKKNAAKVAHNIIHHSLLTFDFDNLNEEMIASVESFLMDYLSCDMKGASTFDEIRHFEYCESKVVDLSNFLYKPSFVKKLYKTCSFRNVYSHTCCNFA